MKPTREMEFVLADGTRIRRGISGCWIELPQGRGHPVILGAERDDALPGVVTLEEMGLVFNLFERSLQPMRARLTLRPACVRLSRTATDSQGLFR